MMLRCEDFGGLGLRCDAGVRRWWLGLNLLAAANVEMQLAVRNQPLPRLGLSTSRLFRRQRPPTSLSSPGREAGG